MNDLYTTLINVLKQNNKYFSNSGDLLRNIVQEDIIKHDSQLLHLLHNNEITNKFFFTTIDNIAVFDQLKFNQIIDNKQFLPDSYTRFKNKIGLYDYSNNFISTNNDVELIFPYKDCILEGNQTKPKEKRKEIFYNENLASDEIDRLLYPKVLTNIKKYSSTGIEQINNFNDDDNIIFKGNNLLVLSSLLSRFRNKIKCIYIDPPYNTGSDDFRYNDNFKHSSWLTFMKNRLVLAKKLLRKDGSIFVQIDHHELGYLIVLMDEIFGAKNKVQIISIKTSSSAGFKTTNPGPVDVTEYILFYAKSKANFNFKKSYVPVSYDKNYNKVVTKNNDGNWTFTPIKNMILQEAGFKSEKEAKKIYGDEWKIIEQYRIEQYALKNANNIVSKRDPQHPSESLKELLAQSKKTQKVLEYKQSDGNISYVYDGGLLAFYSNKVKTIKGHKVATELLTDFWSHISWAGIAQEGKVQLKDGKKPEKLLQQILDIATEENDIVLDFFLGSGTTCAVAHKMNRKYIGCEQLDYGENDSVVRLQNVINGDKTGISSDVNWKGGGSFVYCELKKLNQNYIDRIEESNDKEEMNSLYKDLINNAFISYKITPGDLLNSSSDFSELSIDNQKKFLMEILDKNQLYVNACDIDDVNMHISEDEKNFTRQFYKEK